jgi:hypothetical protein
MVKSNHALWLWGFNISLTPSFSINAVWMEKTFTLYLTCEAAENMEKMA